MDSVFGASLSRDAHMAAATREAPPAATTIHSFGSICFSACTRRWASTRDQGKTPLWATVSRIAGSGRASAANLSCFGLFGVVRQVPAHVGDDLSHYVVALRNLCTYSETHEQLGKQAFHGAWLHGPGFLAPVGDR